MDSYHERDFTIKYNTISGLTVCVVYGARLKSLPIGVHDAPSIVVCVM